MASGTMLDDRQSDNLVVRDLVLIGKVVKLRVAKMRSAD